MITFKSVFARRVFFKWRIVKISAVNNQSGVNTPFRIILGQTILSTRGVHVRLPNITFWTKNVGYTSSPQNNLSIFCSIFSPYFSSILGSPM